MPREDTARTQHNRDGLRYPSDLADREWALIAPLLPLARPVGRPRTADLRSVTDAMFHVALSGCQWWALPKDFPPVSTVRGYFSAWRNIGLWQIINHLVVMSTRELEELKATLIVTAKLNDVHPQAWLADVLTRLANLPVSRLPELLPWTSRQHAALQRAAWRRGAHVERDNGEQTVTTTWPARTASRMLRPPWHIRPARFRR